MIKRYGIKSFFYPTFDYIYRLTYPSIVYCLLNSLLMPLNNAERIKRFEKPAKDIKLISKIFLDFPKLLYKGTRLISEFDFLLNDLFNPLHKKENRHISLNLNSDAFFVLFSLFAIFLESSTDPKKYLEANKNNPLPPFGYINTIFWARFEPVDKKRIQKEIKKCRFTKAQQDIVLKWTQHELNFIKKR